MSRCVSLNHARANASEKAAKSAWKRLEISRYAGSLIIAISVVAMTVDTLRDASCAAGAMSDSSGSMGIHWFAPAGDFTSCHS